jgi:replicative DNA helicase
MTEPTPTPWSPESEAAVIGAAMIDPEALLEVRSWLPAEAFFREAHRVIYRVILELHDRGDPTDLVTVLSRLQDTQQEDQAGGAAYLAEVYNTTVTAANVRYHARVVRDKAALRKLIDSCRSVIETASRANGNAREVIQQAEERILSASHQRTNPEWVGAADSVREAMAYIEEAQSHPDGIVGLRSGFSWLDKLMGGLRKGDLTVLAARPAMGKSAMGWQFARNPATKGHHTAIASYEMSRARIFHRGLAAESGIDSHRLKTANVTPEESSLLASSASRVQGFPIHTLYPPPRTVEGLRSTLRRLMRKHPVELFVVDYLQQMDGSGQNRNNQVEHISRNLKRIATEMDVHVLALAQLSRGVEHRQPPRPMLSDLRDSGAIEQDADNVLLLWRPEVYFDERTPDELYAKWQGKGELIVAKQRDGETGRVVLGWNGPTLTFSEIDTRTTEPGWMR